MPYETPSSLSLSYVPLTLFYLLILFSVDRPDGRLAVVFRPFLMRFLFRDDVYRSSNFASVVCLEQTVNELLYIHRWTHIDAHENCIKQSRVKILFFLTIIASRSWFRSLSRHVHTFVIIQSRFRIDQSIFSPSDTLFHPLFPNLSAFRLNSFYSRLNCKYVDTYIRMYVLSAICLSHKTGKCNFLIRLENGCPS